MMLQERIHTDLKSAMRDGDAVRRDTLRLLESAIKNVAIEKKTDRNDMKDEDVEEVLRRAVKQRRDSIEQYERGGREDLAERERVELAILKEYLPEPLGEDELRELVRRALEATGASSVRDFGKVMGWVMRESGGRADGDAVKKIVQESLPS